MGVKETAPAPWQLEVLFYHAPAPNPAGKRHPERGWAGRSPSLLQEEPQTTVICTDKLQRKEQSPKTSAGNSGFNIPAPGREKTPCRNGARELAAAPRAELLPALGAGSEAPARGSSSSKGLQGGKAQLLARRGLLVCEAAEQGGGRCCC